MHTQRTCSHVVKTHYRTPQLLRLLRNITDRTNVLLQEFRFNLNRELSQITDEAQRRRVLIQSTVTRQCLWLRAGYLMGLNRGQHRLTSPQSWRSPIPPSSPSKPHQAILPDHPPSYSLIPEPTNVPLLPPPLSERSLDYTNGHDRKDSPSLSCKLHSLRPNQTSRKQEHTSRPECIILAVK